MMTGEIDIFPVCKTTQVKTNVKSCPSWRHRYHSFEIFRIFEFPKIWKTSLRIFQNFRKAFFQFQILILLQYKTIFRCLQFWGKARMMVYKLKFTVSITCTFPKKYKYLNIFLLNAASEIRNWKTAFRKFGKFEEGSSNFSNIRKIR